MSTTANDRISDPWLRRVQALLAKAESTDFTAEAEVLLAKAQELMARHAIDEAMLAAAGGRADHIVTTRVRVEPPYASPKATLLGAVARANRCRMVMEGGGRGPRHCVLVGHSSDIANVEALFAALSLHATRAMLATPVPPHDGARRFRHAFLLAFAARIGQRLRQAAAAAEADAERSTATSVALVLVDRDAAVEEALREQFPYLRNVRASASSSAGLAHGRRAADAAPLGQPGVAGVAGRLSPG